jgi:gliding motility-associated-like protein
MRRILSCIFLLFVLESKAQVCDPNGNVFLFTSFVGDVAVINVDVAIPDLRIGIFTSSAVKIFIIGPYVDQVTEIVYAGSGTPNGGACGILIDSVEITGIPQEAIKLYDLSRGRIGFTSRLGDDADFLPFPYTNCMFAPKSACDATAEELNNGAGQIVRFFLDEFGVESSLYAHFYEEECLSGNYFLSQGGNCCITETSNAPNPIYETNHSYNFFESDTLELCDTAITLDLGFYPFFIQPPEFPGIVWNTGATGPTIEVTQTGEYSFTAVDFCAYAADTFLSDTIRIVQCCSIYDDLVISSNLGDTVCVGEEVVLSTNFEEVQWSNGNIDDMLYIDSPQTLSASVDINGCLKNDSITIRFIPPPVLSISIDSPICPNTNIFLSAEGASNFLWNNSILGDSIVIGSDTDIEINLVGSIGECATDSVFYIDVFPLTEFQLGSDIALEFPGTATFTPNQPVNEIEFAGDFFIDCDNCNEVIIDVQNSGVVIGKYVDEFGCRYFDTLQVDLEFECNSIFIPTAFSPDENELNERFCIYSECIDSFDLSIFNRLGTMVYRSTDPDQCWDGRYMDERVKQDYYFYILNAQFSDGRSEMLKGFFILVR